MKYINRIICLILAGTIVPLAACSQGAQNGDNNAAEQTGRYVESDVTPPIDGRFASFLAADGTVVCFSEGLVTRYDSSDGGISWAQSPGPGENNPLFQDIRSGTLLPDGSILAYIQGSGLIKIAPDGSSEPYHIAEIDEAIEKSDNVFVSLLQSLGNDRLIIGYMIGGMVMQARPQDSTMQDSTMQDSASQDSAMQGSSPQRDSGQRGSDTRGGSSFGGEITNKTLLLEASTGKTVADLPDDNATAASSNGENMYLMDTQGTVKAYGLADGAPASTPPVAVGKGSGMLGKGMMPMIGSSGNALAASGDGGLYALYDRNLLLCGDGGAISNILEGTAYSIGSPNSSAESVLVLSDGSIIVNMLEGMQANRLYKYVWDETATVDPYKRLSVWSLEENAFVRAAIAELRKTNPDSYITYEVALGGDNAVSASDAIKTLNTKLISGNGPDIMILDGCPAESYADKGMLLELSGLVDTDDVYPNLLSLCVTEEKFYFMPMQFVMPALIGQADALGKVQTLDALIDLVVNGNDTSSGQPGAGPLLAGIPENERAALYFEDLKELCDIMWLSAAPAIVKDNRLDTDSLKRYLEAVKSISDKYGLADRDNENTIGMSVAFSNGGQTTAVPSSLVRYTSQMTDFGAFAAGNLMLLQMMMERDGSELAPFPGLAQGAWRPTTVTGISADTSVPDFAAELLRTMISSEVQRLNYGAGLPVTHDGIAEEIKEINVRLAENGRDLFVIDMDGLINNLSEPSIKDTILTEMVQGSVDKLCSGKIDVEGAVKEIEQNIKNYLAERS